MVHLCVGLWLNKRSVTDSLSLSPRERELGMSQLGVQLPPTPELLTKHCQRVTSDHGEMRGWDMPDDAMLACRSFAMC